MTNELENEKPEAVPPTNRRSDVAAKLAFIAELLRRGFETAVVSQTPADITATRDGHTHFFEVKYTSQTSAYFGAATLTEWEAAIENEGRFTFVVAYRRDGRWLFHEYSPAEFMAFSTIPPFKAYFNVAVELDRDTRVRGQTRSVRLTRDKLARMSALFRSFRSE